MNIKISDQDAEYMYNLVDRIVNEVGPRMPCSLPEKEGAKILREELEKVCDKVDTEKFTCHPKAFLGWIKIITIVVFLSIIVYIIYIRISIQKKIN